MPSPSTESGDREYTFDYFLHLCEIFIRDDADAEDPWRPATPHSWYAPARPDTIVRPFKMIKAGVHHYDENGLKNHTLEPPQIKHIHTEEVEFVKSWLGL